MALLLPRNRILYDRIMSRITTQAQLSAAQLAVGQASGTAAASMTGSSTQTTASGSNVAGSRISTSTALPVYEERIHEFDDCRYLLSARADGSMRLSLALPDVGEQYNTAASQLQSRTQLMQNFKQVARLVEPAEDGYQVTLELDTRLLCKLSSGLQTMWAGKLASLRLDVIGHPLRQHLQALATGACVPGPAQAVCTRPGCTFFVKPSDNSLTLVFPVRFVSRQDVAMGTAFLQEFDAARTAAVLGQAPGCSFKGMNDPPEELSGVDPCDLQGVNGGYMVFTLHPNHVNGPHMEHVLWSMCTFYHLVSYHIKTCKVMLHQRMRRKVESMQQALNFHSLSSGRSSSGAAAAVDDTTATVQPAAAAQAVLA